MKKLEEFLEEWDRKNTEQHNKIALFNPEMVETLNIEQRHYFVRVFYHLRGHFVNFLWYAGNTAPNEQIKKVILDNIREEFSGKEKSHEQLYWEFAQGLGVDLTDELLNERTYVPFANDFNRKHLEWLHSHDWESGMAAFSAYERLDNIDYADLLTLAKNFGAEGRSILFFEVHSKVRHYEMVSEGFNLGALWDKSRDKVIEAYEFIWDHQNEMWRNLSDAVFNHSLP